MDRLVAVTSVQPLEDPQKKYRVLEKISEEASMRKNLKTILEASIGKTPVQSMQQA